MFNSFGLKQLKSCHLCGVFCLRLWAHRIEPQSWAKWRREISLLYTRHICGSFKVASNNTKSLAWGPGLPPAHLDTGWIPGVSKAETLCWGLFTSSLAGSWIISILCLHGLPPLPTLLRVFLTRMFMITLYDHPHKSRSVSPQRIMRSTDLHFTIEEL